MGIDEYAYAWGWLTSAMVNAAKSGESWDPVKMLLEVREAEEAARTHRTKVTAERVKVSLEKAAA